MDEATIKIITNSLRQGSIFWQGRKDCLKLAREIIVEKYKGKRKEKFYWKCADCKELFRDVTSMEVDHIDPVGPYKGCWNEFVARMFCEQSNLQCLCIGCHLKKTTSVQNATALYSRRVEVRQEDLD